MMLNSFFSNPAWFTIVLIFVFIWFFVLSFFLFRAIIHYRQLTKGITKKNIQAVLENVLAEIKNDRKETEKVNARVDRLEKEKTKYIQKLGFLRFNPFSDTGGDQSFCLTFLDEKENGIILSSLHSRGATRLYAKVVEKGKGKTFSLSKEEEEVIKKAKKGRQ